MAYRLPIAELKARLEQVDETLLVECNEVGNLRLSSPDGEYRGFIEMSPSGGVSLLPVAANDDD